MFYHKLFFLFGVSVLVFACESKPQSKLNKSQTIRKTHLVKPVLGLKSDSGNNELKDKNVKQVAEIKGVPPRVKNKKSISKPVSKSSISSTTLELKKPNILEKWKNTCSQDQKWMDLYESSRTYFLNGWREEFEKHPNARISKEELLLAYRKRMENIFYETPSFIEFSVQEVKASVEFAIFCQKWEENVIG